jgi:hypothetical protein
LAFYRLRRLVTWFYVFKAANDSTSFNVLKITMGDWQCMQEHQQQMAAVAAAAKRNERSEVITLTRQNADVGSPVLAPLMEQHRYVLEI